MGLLVNGKWHDEWYDTTSTGGEFIRQDAQFRNWIGEPDFEAEADRYHLFVSLACPWAHRTLIFRKLKKLEDVIGMTVVDPIRDERGWAFRNGSGYSEDPINDFKFLSEAYKATYPNYNARVTVPVFWDKKTGRIVSNVDDDIMRMFNSEFDDFTNIALDFYPEEFRDEIDKVNDLDRFTLKFIGYLLLCVALGGIIGNLIIWGMR